MCDTCENKYATGGIRPCPATDHELALLAKARRTTDPKKLAAMLPGWLKRELFKAPKPFEFKAGQPPVYPAWTRPSPMSCESIRAIQFEWFDRKCKDGRPETVQEYVNAWNEAQRYA